MILNEKYYQNFWTKFSEIKALGSFNSNISNLSTKLILSHHYKNLPIHLNFQNSKDLIYEIGKQLFIELANDIYLNHYDLPNLKKGNRLRDKRMYADGKKHEFIIKNISNGTYLLEHTKKKYSIKPKYDSLVRNFIPIEKGSRLLKGYTQYFSDLNGGMRMDFTPTNFEKKTVFIARKSLWDSILDKNKIPCSYLPNPREENTTTTIKSIPALHDCLSFFAPKYEVCYQNILLKEEKVKTVIVFDTEMDKIEQILQDKSRFGFNLIIISNDYSPSKNDAIPCWNWFKEEIDIVNAL